MTCIMSVGTLFHKAGTTFRINSAYFEGVDDLQDVTLSGTIEDPNGNGSWDMAVEWYSGPLFSAEVPASVTAEWPATILRADIKAEWDPGDGSPVEVWATATFSIAVTDGVTQ